MDGDPTPALTGRRRTRPTSIGCRKPWQPKPGRAPLIAAQAAVQTNRATSHPLTSTTASAKAALRALARRWLTLDAEIKAHDGHLDTLTAACAPTLMEAHGISTGTAAEMLILVGD